MTAHIGDAFLAIVRELVRAEVDRAVGELRGALGPARDSAAAEWLDQVTAAAIAGVRPQAVRAWQKAGVISRGRRGRVNAGELRRFLAASGVTSPAVANLTEARARATAEKILGGARRGPAGQ